MKRYKIPTNYNEFTLLVRVTTPRPEKIHFTLKDADQAKTVFTDRWATIHGSQNLYIRVPASGKTAILEVYNEAPGKNNPGTVDNSFQVDTVRMYPLEKKTDIIDYNNRAIREFVAFCTKFCFNAGVLQPGTYHSRSRKFVIEYLPTIMGDNGRPLQTPARITRGNEYESGGTIEVSKEKFDGYTVPMRMIVLLHEFSHYYVNETMADETEADLNGLLIYLGLGYPRIEAHEAFLKIFIGTPTEANKQRYQHIEAFIDHFEKQQMSING